MRTGILYFFTAAALIGVVHGLVVFRSEFIQPPVEVEFSPNELLELTAVEREELLEASRSSASALGVSVERLKDHALFLRKLAMISTDDAERMNLLCESLSILGQALATKPIDSRYLVNWANIKQILGAYDCGMDFTRGEFIDAVELALRKDPTNTSVMYSGALVYVWARKPEKTRELINQVLSYETRLNPGQVRFVDSLIQTPEDLVAVLPARFPQVVNWAARLEGGSRERFKKLRPTLAKVQLEAIDELERVYQRGKIPLSIYEKNLLGVLDHAASTEVRRRADLSLVPIFRRRGEREIADFLEKRAQLKKLDIVRAVLSSDTRPLKAPLANWASRISVNFDQFYSSIGFFLPEQQGVRYIQLKSRAANIRLNPEAVRVFVSDDNQRWNDLTSRVEIKVLHWGRNTRAVIKTEPSSFKYWKVHYPHSTRESKFSNQLGQLISVYGHSARKEQS